MIHIIPISNHLISIPLQNVNSNKFQPYAKFNHWKHLIAIAAETKTFIHISYSWQLHIFFFIGIISNADYFSKSNKIYLMVANLIKIGSIKKETEIIW